MRTSPFERDDFTYLSRGVWSIEQDSNLRIYCFADSRVGPLRHRCINCLASREGHDPPTLVLETRMLPITLPRHCLVLPLGFEPRSSPHLEASPGYKPGALTVMLWEQNLERVVGFEPTAFSLARKHSTPELYPHETGVPTRCRPGSAAVKGQ